jgi:hypothetical protein
MLISTEPRLCLERLAHNFSMFAYRSVALKEDFQLDPEAMATSTTPSEESGAIQVQARLAV